MSHDPPDWHALGFRERVGGEAVDDWQSRELARSAAHQQWGAAVSYQQAQQGGFLAYMEMPSWTARLWTVSLLAFRYQGGPLVAGNGTPDQQVLTSVGNLAVNIEYGVGNASEYGVVVDYPWAGTSFELVASAIKVSLVGAGLGTIQLNVGAFIAPAARSRYANGATRTQTITIVNGASGFVSVPPRAARYSAFPANQAAAGNATGFVLEQVTIPAAGAGTVRVDDNRGWASGATGETPLSQYAGYSTTIFPLERSCSAIKITNNNAFTCTYGLLFELDL